MSRPELRGELLRNEPMSRHTSWRVGGPADSYYRPADADDLAVFLAQLPADEPITWLGLGSNLLVRDGGIRGTVIATQGRLNAMGLCGEGRVRAEAGVTCAHLARFSAKAGLCGLEFLAGIPGTVGGALRMNAGAFGGETWRALAEVETLNRMGEVGRRSPADFAVGYREVKGLAADEWFLAGTWELQPGDAKAGQEHIKGLLGRRAQTQPTTEASCGSVFRNPEGDHAGRLIEAAGLKGYCIGAAAVSSKHANFIINTGNARAADIEALIGEVRNRVLGRFGVHLVSEVHVLGEAV